MSRYHLYYLLENALTGSESIEADDDGEARRIARDRAGARTVEVWSGHERVGVISRPAARATTVRG